MKKKIIARIAAVSAIFFLGAFAFAEGYLSANDLEKGEITSVKNEEDGFVLNASAEKNITVDKCPVHTASDGESYTQRIKLNGSGSATARSISFPAKKGETIVVRGNSGSKTEARPLLIVNDAGETLTQINMEADPSGAPLTEGKFKVPADGTYTVYSKKSGINLYYIGVVK